METWDRFSQSLTVACLFNYDELNFFKWLSLEFIYLVIHLITKHFLKLLLKVFCCQIEAFKEPSVFLKNL